IACFFLVEVIADQQVRAETDAFPADKHQHEVVAEHERQHREHEQVEKREEAIEAFLTVHVTDGKDVNQKTNKGDEERIRSAQTIHREREVSVESSNRQPGPDVIEHRRLRTQRAARHERKVKGNDRRDSHRPTRNNAYKALITHTPSDEPINGRPRQRRKNNQTEKIILHSDPRKSALPKSARSVATVLGCWPHPHPTFHDCERWR